MEQQGTKRRRMGQKRRSREQKRRSMERKREAREQKGEAGNKKETQGTNIRSREQKGAAGNKTEKPGTNLMHMYICIVCCFVFIFSGPPRTTVWPFKAAGSHFFIPGQVPSELIQIAAYFSVSSLWKSISFDIIRYPSMLYGALMCSQ